MLQGQGGAWAQSQRQQQGQMWCPVFSSGLSRQVQCMIFCWVLEPPFLAPGSPASLLKPGRIPSSLSVRSGAPLLVLPGITSLSVLSCFPHQTNSPQNRDHVCVHFSTPVPSPQPKKMLLFLNECLTLWEKKQPGRVLTRRPHPAGRLKG